MLRAVRSVERPRRACPVLTGWEGSFNRYEDAFNIMNDLYFFQNVFSTNYLVILTGGDFLAKVIIDGLVKPLALSMILNQVLYEISSYYDFQEFALIGPPQRAGAVSKKWFQDIERRDSWAKEKVWQK